MKAKLLPRASRARLASLAAVVALLAGSAAAQVAGRITTTEDKAIQGTIRWKAVAKCYVVSTSRPGSAQIIDIEIAPDKVARVDVPPPKELQQAIQLVQSGKPAGATAVLEKIATEYAMLQWDEPATRWLAEAHLLNNDANAAVKACERVIANRQEAAYLGEMAVTYWQALRKSGKTAKLNDYIEEAIKSGGREAAANALILRGDVLMDQRLPREALKDGYLRVIVLYESLRAVQPEALFKAAKAFEALQQIPNAEKMRTMLRTQYGSSEYARQI